MDPSEPNRTPSPRALAEGIEHVVNEHDLTPDDTFALGVAAGILRRLDDGSTAPVNKTVVIDVDGGVQTVSGRADWVDAFTRRFWPDVQASGRHGAIRLNDAPADDVDPISSSDPGHTPGSTPG